MKGNSEIKILLKNILLASKTELVISFILNIKQIKIKESNAYFIYFICYNINIGRKI